MASYYFRRISDGEKVVERTLAAINKRAKAEATKFGQAVQVYVDKAERGVGMRSHRQMSMARNPVPKLRPHVGSWAIIEKKTGKVVTEIWRDDPRIKTLNLAKYKAVPIDVHLASLSVKRNPIDFSPPEYSYFQARGDARGAEVARARKPKRMAAHSRRGWMGGEKKSGGGYVVKVPELKHSEPAGSLEEAKRIARSLAKQGYSAEIHTV